MTFTYLYYGAHKHTLHVLYITMSWGLNEAHKILPLIMLTEGISFVFIHSFLEMVLKLLLTEICLIFKTLSLKIRELLARFP